jgi:hypothetical protein
MASINIKQIQREIKSQQGKLLVREATALVNEQVFVPAVEQLQNAFENDPVTQEIRAGNDSENISNTLEGVKTKGYPANLFSYIGFDNGTDPTEDIEKFFYFNAEYGPKFKYVRGSQEENLRFSFLFDEPNKQAIYDATPMPRAEGLSWADRMEKGLLPPNLSQFLAGEGLKGSHSDGGIQVKGEVSPSAKFIPRPYLSKLIEDYINEIKKRARRKL